MDGGQWGSGQGKCGQMKILWIPHTGWNIPQRAHLFCRSLSERHEVHVTDWVADFRTYRDYLSKKYIANYFYRRYRDGNILVHGIPRISPALFSRSLRVLNDTIFSWVVNQIIQVYQIDVVVSTFVISPPRAPRLIYDLFDDNVAYWKSFGKQNQYALEIEETQNKYYQKADAVVAASSVLMENAMASGARTVVHIPNGVELDKFSEGDQSTQVKERLNIPGKLVGIVGNHDKWNELDRIIRIARLLQGEDISFLIAGRGSFMHKAQNEVRLNNLTNIYFYGYVPPQELPVLNQNLDVGLCPYQKTPGADASSPMRLLVYSASGLPVVCTELEEVKRMNFQNVVFVADTPESMAKGVQTALGLRRQRPLDIYKYDLPVLVSKYQSVLKSV